MSVKKVARKGKLDRDLPFRERKTFAIFPRRFAGWEVGCHVLPAPHPGLSNRGRPGAIGNGRDWERLGPRRASECGVSSTRYVDRVPGNSSDDQHCD